MATGTCSFGYPGLIAAQRYYKISYMPTFSRFSMAEMVFGDKRLVPLMIIWWTISISVNLPLIIFYDEFGEDAGGYCGVKPFREALPFAIFLISVISVFFLSYTFMGVYYYRLGRFLKTRHATESNKESMNITRSIMLMTKIIVIVPMFMMTPTIILTAGQWMLHGLVPMWLNRIIVTLYYIPASMTPWVAIYTLNPFRKQFLMFYFNVKQRLSLEVLTSTVRSVEPR
uniref:G-protein coupled receptors family 1 profile domain-containing protein n=1 Tax=Plectus sambesii TaxID=2011161 RepID=A0A914UM43_9BILA